MFFKDGFGLRAARDEATLVADRIIAVAEASRSGFALPVISVGHGRAERAREELEHP